MFNTDFSLQINSILGFIQGSGNSSSKFAVMGQCFVFRDAVSRAFDSDS